MIYISDVISKLLKQGYKKSYNRNKKNNLKNIILKKDNISIVIFYIGYKLRRINIYKNYIFLSTVNKEELLNKLDYYKK